MQRMDRFIQRLKLAQRYVLPAAVGGGLLLSLVFLALWAAGAFGGGSDDEGAAICEPCPTTSRTPARTRTPTTSATPCCTPSAAPTFGPTEASTTAPTPQPATPEPVPLSYGLAPYLSAPEFNRIVDFAIIPGTDNTEAIVVTQKDERILRVSLTGAFAPAVYGDLSGYVSGGGNEEGLLSATFSPDFASDRRIYVYYTQGVRDGAQQPTVLSRFQVNGNAIETDNETRILEVPDFASNHNGGRVLFGPDGYLYLSTGDGGIAGDPQENGQDINSLLGKVLRLKISGENTYAIPPDNPFAGAPGADEIFAYGFRNPWRYSFDRATGALWLGDVGQGSFEEVDLVVKGGNYGWDCYEGFAAYELEGCPAEGFQLPRAVYSLEGEECAVSGGYVYRGGAMPELTGRYIYGDYCSGKVWALDSANPNAQPLLLLDSEHSVSSFYELPDGELLVLTFSNTIFRLVRA